MKYKIIWSEFSENQIDDIFNYYELISGSYSVALKIVTRILLAPDKLIDNPKIGQIEFLLKDRTIQYHYIVESNYKIIYSVDEENHLIKIADVFDTRQNPDKIHREK
ncbi:type II toxin-antitoxin system RelE/ParE family toxin [Chryseobacterium shandongense]|uniref:type II toxin-antitoxin system RelE/ParE family toxin n=1 Tax=Chryseobacterium shandongense TaxID=1493872 RepID=UPI000F500CD6|nr:type II toxin-antitoxin system RelE/ParE family toxin [Chryseobacterium shandongense]AZA59183.1 type II toxin-antitoxin system RelE/ParE family toxin [Chryseobacterium shandongense]